MEITFKGMLDNVYEVTEGDNQGRKYLTFKTVVDGTEKIGKLNVKVEKDVALPIFDQFSAQKITALVHPRVFRSKDGKGSNQSLDVLKISAQKI